MAAAAFARFLGPRFRITLVESGRDRHGRGGRGDHPPDPAVQRQPRHRRRRVHGAPPRRASSSRIEFVGWTKGGRYMHAFGDIGRDERAARLSALLAARDGAIGVARPLGAYSLNSAAALAN